MTKKEIIEKKMAIVSNDISHFSRQRTELEGLVKETKLRINRLSDKISKKHSYMNLLERDIENLEL